MKKHSHFAIIFLLLLIQIQGISQEDIKTKHESYYLCIGKIPRFNAPFVDKTKEAYENCTAYLQKYPNDDPPLVGFAKNWVKAYENITAYLESIKTKVETDNSQNWAIYADKKVQEIPTKTSNDEKHKVEISRQFADSKEDKLLKIAESVYPNSIDVKAELFQNWRYWAHPNMALPKGEPFWWGGYNDTILSTKIVTTEAVLYYLDVTEKLRNNNKLKENSFSFYSSNLKYWSSIKKVEKFERSSKTFENVYVAEMNLTWGQMCGGLCGDRFTRNKIVVLDENGKVLSLFLDDPINNQRWVS